MTININQNGYAMIEGRKIFVGNGGEGSGNFGHEGRPGEVGGSGEGGSGGDSKGTGWVKVKDVSLPENPALPHWAQGKGADNPKFSSKEEMISSLAKLDYNEMIASSFPGGVDKAKGKTSTVQEIPINALYHSLQGNVKAGWLKESLEGRYGPLKGAITVVKNGDKYMLWDGHHRAEIARALGNTTIKAKVYEPKNK